MWWNWTCHYSIVSLCGGGKLLNGCLHPLLARHIVWFLKAKWCQCQNTSIKAPQSALKKALGLLASNDVETLHNKNPLGQSRSSVISSSSSHTVP